MKNFPKFPQNMKISLDRRLHWSRLFAGLYHHGTLGEEVHLEKNIFENQFFKYKKITKNILTVEKKFHNFSTKNYQNLLGANFFSSKLAPKNPKKR